MNLKTGFEKLDNMAYNLKSITADAGNSYFKAVDGVLYNKKMTELLYYPAFKKGKVFKVPGTVKSIANYAFTDNRFFKVNGIFKAA